MTILQSVLLGILQGLTEFLPVSSSAHLVLAPWLLGWDFDPQAKFAFDVLVQQGTLVAVIVYFWKDLVYIVQAVVRDAWRRRPLASADARLGWLVALATVPAVVLGLAFKDFFESVFANPAATAALLLVTGGLLALGERFERRERDLATLTWADALVIGLAQAAAILPGISRSGATISGGLARGLQRAAAARFSFLMSIPVMLGAAAVALNDLVAVPDFGAYLAPIATGFLAAAVVGYFSIRWLLGYLMRRSMYAFAVYCTLAGLASLAFAAVRG